MTHRVLIAMVVVTAAAGGGVYAQAVRPALTAQHATAANVPPDATASSPALADERSELRQAHVTSAHTLSIARGEESTVAITAPSLDTHKSATAARRAPDQRRTSATSDRAPRTKAPAAHNHATAPTTSAQPGPQWLEIAATRTKRADTAAATSAATDKAELDNVDAWEAPLEAAQSAPTTRKPDVFNCGNPNDTAVITEFTIAP